VLAAVLTKTIKRLCKHAWSTQSGLMTVSEVSAYLKLSQDTLVTLLART